jgi:hypothetical protein
VTTTLPAARPPAVTGRSRFVALAAREVRRFVVNPVFLVGAALIASVLWFGRPPAVTEIDTTRIFLGGFGMLVAFWQTRSMRASEPVVGTTPTTLPMRTAALCTVAIVPLLCGVSNLVAVDWMYGALSPPASIAVRVSQMVLPALGGPLLGVALGRWVRFAGAGFLGFLVLYVWMSLVTVVNFSDPDPTPNVVLRLFAPFAFFTSTDNTTIITTTWRGSPWLFIGWQLALCAIVVLIAVLRGAEGRVRSAIVRALPIVAVVAVILLALSTGGGFAHAVHA